MPWSTSSASSTTTNGADRPWEPGTCGRSSAMRAVRSSPSRRTSACRGDGPELADAVAYFQAAQPSGDDRERRRLDAVIEERGREAGAALGDDPGADLRDLTTRVLALVERSADDEPVATPFGQMTLTTYLPTRTFELAVHGLDLARAVRRDVPTGLLPGIRASCDLAGRLAGSSPAAPDLLLLLVGRAGLPEGLSAL